MPKRKISMPERKTHKSNQEKLAKVDEVIRFVGVSLAGGKSDKACLAVLEYYPKNKKLFLSRLFEKIKSEEKISGDLKIHELILQNKETLHSVAFDIPWRLPSCLSCQLKCPGFENCHEPHIEWMWQHQNEEGRKKRPKKLFTPYTQRCVEMYLASAFPEAFHLHHAMGANVAPLLARAYFIRRRLPNINFVEVFPKIVMWKLGELLGMMKSQLRSHRAAFGGDQSRAQFLQLLNDNNLAFVYHQDAKNMIENSHAFEAFLCGLMAYLNYRNLTEPRPKKFPPNEDWIEFPKSDIKLKDF